MFTEKYQTSFQVMNFRVQLWWYYIFEIQAFKDFIYLFERERSGERERENPKQTPKPSAEPEGGLDLTTLRSWPEPKPRVQCSTYLATQAPLRSGLLQLVRVGLTEEATSEKTWRRWLNTGGLSDMCARACVCPQIHTELLFTSALWGKAWYFLLFTCGETEEQKG